MALEVYELARIAVKILFFLQCQTAKKRLERIAGKCFKKKGSEISKPFIIYSVTTLFFTTNLKPSP